MPYIKEELRRTLISELEGITQKIQDVRYFVDQDIGDKDLVEDDLSSVFKNLFEITQALRELEGEEWIYPRSSQYRNHFPRNKRGAGQPDPLAYLQDVPTPPEPWEIFEEDPRTGARKLIRRRLDSESPPVNAPPIPETEPQPYSPVPIITTPPATAQSRPSYQSTISPYPPFTLPTPQPSSTASDTRTYQFPPSMSGYFDTEAQSYVSPYTSHPIQNVPSVISSHSNPTQTFWSAVSSSDMDISSTPPPLPHAIKLPHAMTQSSQHHHDPQSSSSSISSKTRPSDDSKSTQFTFLQRQIDEIRTAKAMADKQNLDLMNQIIQGQQHMAEMHQQLQHLQQQNIQLSNRLNNPHLYPHANEGGFANQGGSQPLVVPTAQPSAPIPNSTMPTQDVNLALMQMLKAQQEFFMKQKSEISTVKFPKFSGGTQAQFRAWYDSILSVLATPAWHTVYSDIPTKTLKVDSEISEDLSIKLFSALRTSISGSAETVMMTKKKTWGKGLLYLETLRLAYTKRLKNADILRKEAEFASLFMKPSETIDAFGARCLEMKDTLEENGITTTPQGVKIRFIMGLGPTFTEIQKKDEQDLPEAWQTVDMELLINAAKEYRDGYLAVQEQNKLFKAARTQQDIPPRQSQPASSSQIEPKSKSEQKKKTDLARQARIRTCIVAGTFDPKDFMKEVGKGCCIWHNVPSHDHPDCNAINDLLELNPNQRYYNKPMQSNKQIQWARGQKLPPPPPPTRPGILKPPSSAPTTTPPASTPTARHVQNTTQTADDNVHMDTIDEVVETLDSMLQNTVTDNHSNNSVSNYSPCDNNKNQSSNTSINKYRFVLDSGAYPHMCKHPELFINMQPTTDQSVTLADGKSTTPVRGIGNIKIQLKNNTITLDNVLYVPQLSESLFSAKKHQEQQGNYIHIAENHATVAFPTFTHSFPILEEMFMKVTKPTTKQATVPPKRSQQQQKPHNKIMFTKIHDSAITPCRGTPDSAGLDLFSCEQTTIQPGERKTISTGIAIAIPTLHFGHVKARSSVSVQGIDVGAGVIDADYRGEIKVLLINNSCNPFEINISDKIAQIIIQKISMQNLEEVESLSLTTRGAKGFGSTNTPVKTSNKIPNESTENFKLTKINSTSTKITIKLPWMESHTKGYIEKHPQGYSFSSISDSTIKHIIPASTIKKLANTKDLLIGHHHLIQRPNLSNKPPPTRVIDLPLANVTPNNSHNINQLRKSFGFRNVDSILKELQLTSSNLNISTNESEPILDLGEITTQDKKARNTLPSDLPDSFGDVIHADILFGSNTAITGIKYALYLVDKATRHKFIYPLKNLKTDMIPTFQQFVKDINKYPLILRTDFDHKLMGNDVLTFFNNHTQSSSQRLRTINI